MPTAIEPPDAITEASLFEKALAADEADGVEPSHESQAAAKKAFERAAKPDSESEAPETEKETPEGEKPPPEVPDGDRDPRTGRFKPKKPPEAAQAPKEAAVPPGKEPEPEVEAPPEVADPKEQKRIAKAWQKVQERQRELAESAQFQQQQAQQLQQAAREYQQRMGPARATKEGFSAPEYRKYSGQFFADAQRQGQEGDLDSSNKSLANAYKALATAEQLEAYEYQQQNQGIAQYYDGAFRQDMQRVGQEHPEVWDEKNPLTGDIKAVLDTYKELYWLPQGFQKAYEIGVLRQAGREVVELRKKVAELEGANGQLNSKLEPARGGASTQRGERDFKDMSFAEKERKLMEDAYELDAQGVPAVGHGFQ